MPSLLPIAAWLGARMRSVLPIAAWRGARMRSLLPIAAWLGARMRSLLPIAAWLGAWMRSPLPIAAAALVLAALIGSAPAAPDASALALAPARPTTAATEPGPSGQAVVTVSPDAHGAVVPRSFLGLATEWSAIPVYEQEGALFHRLLVLLRSPGDGPLLLRVGGLSADDTLWAPVQTAALPERADLLTPAGLAQIGGIVRSAHLRVILDLNLAADIPMQEAALASAAERALPRHSIVAFEVGNEPDYYRFALRDNPPYYPAAYTASLYAARFRSYAAALRDTVPGVTLAGPALANPVDDFSYLRQLVSRDRASVGMLTVHRYALSACAPARSAMYPTLSRLLRPSASVGLAETLRRTVALAHANHLPVRWDEFNSVTCGGTLGVSDSFASALWGTDTLFAALAVGVDGVNVQMRPTALNAPFYLDRAGVQTRPLLYGILLFLRALGPGARLAPVSVAEPASANLAAWALRLAGGRLNVVALNKADAPQTVVLRMPRDGAGVVQRLLAASIRTRSQVTLAGQAIDAAGRWAGRLTTTTPTWAGDGYRIVLPPFSGALISFGG